MKQMSTALLELRYGTRWLLRGNWFARRSLRSLRRQETMSAEGLRVIARKHLFATMQNAIAYIPFYRDIDPNFSAGRDRASGLLSHHR
jgi:hypothetical protein